jgi:uncharacterized protein (TIGR02246 family)
MRPRFARFSTVKSRRGTTVIPTATRAISPRMVPFTNIGGMFFTGHQEFRDRQEAIFKGEFRGTSLKQETVCLRFIRPDVAIAETLTWVSGFSKAGPPPGTQLDANGRLRTRLLQVLKKDGGVWKIVVYHNVDIKPGVPVPESR